MGDGISTMDFFDIIYSDRNISLDYISHFIGRPYIWGGDDPLVGFDCSGLCVEWLKSNGKIEINLDFTAMQLYRKFPLVDKPYRGCLVYYGSAPDKVSHMGICLNDHLVLTASGGGSLTVSLQEAVAADAFVKVRSIYYRRDLVGFNDPFLNL